ncbi:hypothetical protein ACHAXA_011627 [Cyclostephanos tholiformis]|uniref:PROP1-like PPR domain-containing protein n=1 Tax=Cyclostephanos tholiformis TaxID=382380 RepID=A0ABD3RV89_9STRA
MRRRPAAAADFGHGSEDHNIEDGSSSPPSSPCGRRRTRARPSPSMLLTTALLALLPSFRHLHCPSSSSSSSDDGGNISGPMPFAAAFRVPSPLFYSLPPTPSSQRRRIPQSSSAVEFFESSPSSSLFAARWTVEKREPPPVDDVPSSGMADGGVDYDDYEDYDDDHAKNDVTSSSSSSSIAGGIDVCDLRRRMRPYANNDEVERAMARLGRRGQTNEALRLYRDVWAIDVLRGRLRRIGGGGTSSGDRDDADKWRRRRGMGVEGTTSSSMTREELSNYLNVVSRNLRPTTRLMNTAIDACARSSYLSPSSSTSTSSASPSSSSPSQLRRGENRRMMRTRTQMALDIFLHGTSPWEENDDENNNVELLFGYVKNHDHQDNDNEHSVGTITMARGERRRTLTTKMTTTTTTVTMEKRRKKYGGSLSPNVYTFGAMLACAARDGDVDSSMRILGMLEDGEYPDVSLNQVIYSTVISACANHCVTNSNDDGFEIDCRGGKRMSDDDIVKLALKVLNRGIGILSKGEGVEGMGVVGYNAVISTMARTGRWRMAVQLLGEMILYSSLSSTTTSFSPHSSSNSSSSSSQSSSSSSYSFLRRTNPNFLPMEIIRDHISSAPLLLHWRSSSSLTEDKDGFIHDDDRCVITPKPDAVTFGTVLSACEKSSQWNTALDVARAATEYGVKLDGMALTSILHSCQQLGLADEALYYLEMMKQLGDDKEIDKNCNGEGEAVDSAARQQRQQHPQDSDGRKTNGRQRKGARQPLRGPDGVAYRLAISACARSPGGHRWQDGIRLLREMKSISAGNNITDCTPDVIAYTAAIAGCSEAGEYAHAMSLIKEMIKEGIRPNVMTFSAVINACAMASAKLARRREEDDLSGRDYSNINVDGNNITMGLENVRMPMNRALKLLTAMKAPRSSVKPNIVTYNAAIRACAEGLNLDGAFDLLRQLKEDGLEPTIITYGSLMTACERVGDIEAASKVFRIVKEEEGRNKKKFSGGSDGCNVDDGSEGQEHIRANEIIYGAAISCCRKAREPERALLLLRKMMSEKLEPNTVTFNTVIAALSEGRLESKTTKDDLLWEKALAVYRVMKSKHTLTNVTPNRKTYNILIRCLSANLQPGLAESLLIDMREAGFVPDVDLYTMTVRSYERCGNPMKALSLMEYMREMGYDFYEIKVLDEVFKNGVKEMIKEGIRPNVMTFSAVINACAMASAKLARRREEDDLSGRDYSNINVDGNNITMGLENVRMPMNRALKLLTAMKAPRSSVKPNIVTYNAAIRACAEGLNLDGAFDLLRQLKEDGLEPTIITYGSLMTACERVGDIEAASKVFRIVKEEEGRNKKKFSGGSDGCNVDDGSEGQEHIRANEIIYGAAISCCRKAREPEQALLLLRKMMSEKLEPNTVTFNTVIAALSEGRLESKTTKDDLLWEKALAVYRVMKSKHTLTNVTPNHKTYNILIRCLSANLQPGLAESLLIDMREAGFVPDVDLYTMTVRSYERCGNPMKALSLMEYMREMGYDFYEIKVLDEVFKNGVKLSPHMLIDYDMI